MNTNSANAFQHAMNPENWTGLVTAIGVLVTAVGGIVIAVLNFINNRKAVVARVDLNEKMDRVEEKADTAAVKAQEVKNSLQTVNTDHRNELAKITVVVNGNALRERKVLMRRIADLSGLATDEAIAREAERALSAYESTLKTTN